MSNRFVMFHKETNNQLKEPMFFGKPVNLARYDQQKYEIFEKFTEKQLSFFWRPEEIDVSKDRMDFANLPEHEKHIFVSNLSYQCLLDSVQGRAPIAAFLNICSLPELENWIIQWSQMETIHSRSYTHIIRNIINDPSIIFDEIVPNLEIQKRADSVTKYYDDLIELGMYYNLLGEGKHTVNGKEIVVDMYELKKKLYLCMMQVNILEAIRFYVSFACSFNFAERKVMEGNAKIIKLISRDEQLHLSSTQQILSIMRSGQDDPDFEKIYEETKLECMDMFWQAAEQEKEWAKYLFKDGSMIGLNEHILNKYVEYITNTRMKAVGLDAIYSDTTTNPIPWINNWLTSDNVQVAPQEVEISSYLIGQVDSDLSDSDFDEFDL